MKIKNYTKQAKDNHPKKAKAKEELEMMSRNDN